MELINKSIKEQLKIIPNLPGSYQYYDKDNNVIYVGKAKNLKKRVSSYFKTSYKESSKLRVLVPKIVKIEYIITNNEVEALILESHLIKKYKPKYNVLLKDDKKYPYFVITEEEYPRIIVARKGNKNPIKGKYFGPYTDSRAMYATLDLLKRLFPLKQCKSPKFKDRPCMYYHIKRCNAPCQKLITPEEYKKIIKKVQIFLSGKQQQLVDELKNEMLKYSEKEQYEKAARYRDSFLDVKKTMENQKVVFENTSINQDIIGVSSAEGLCAITVLQIREGRLIGKKDFEYTYSNIDSLNEVIESFIREYYQLLSDIEMPDTIITSEFHNLDNIQVYNEWLSAKACKEVKIIDGLDSKKDQDLKLLADKNSDYYLEKLKIKALAEIQTDYNEIGSYIQEKLGLNKFPYRVECFDISHIQGTNTVGSMVVFENGIPKKSLYRKFKIKTVENKPDDFCSMREVVRRRYTRLLRENKELPDLIIIDGGKGQLSSTVEIIKTELGLYNQDIVSLAKKLEEVFIPEKSEPVIFPLNSQALYFFQRIRDEAHRFAITFHRLLRDKTAKRSLLDEIKGLSEKNKEILLKKYKSIAAIRSASLNELSALISKRGAISVFNFFNK